MRLFSIIKLPVVLLLAGTLSACGFHLRDEYSVPEELSSMSFSSYDNYSALSRYVRSQLEFNGVDITIASENTPSLHIISAEMDERTLSLYQNTRAAEKELTYEVEYTITIPELGATSFTTSVTRNYLDNPLTVLAKSVERDVIEDEMRKQAATQMMRQLGRVKAKYEAGLVDLTPINK